jgi:hypothetical protein
MMDAMRRMAVLPSRRDFFRLAALGGFSKPLLRGAGSHLFEEVPDGAPARWRMPEPIAFSNMPSPDFVLPCEDGHLQTPHRIVDVACAHIRCFNLSWMPRPCNGGRP